MVLLILFKEMLTELFYTSVPSPQEQVDCFQKDAQKLCEVAMLAELNRCYGDQTFIKKDALGLSIDENEALRILPTETEKGSKEISAKTKLLLTNLSQVNEQLEITIKMLQVLDEQTKNMRIAELASNILRLTGYSKGETSEKDKRAS